MRRAAAWLAGGLVLLAFALALVASIGDDGDGGDGRDRQLSEEEEEEAIENLRSLRAPPGGGSASRGEPLYESRNTDGQAGSGGRAVPYHSGGRPIAAKRVRAEAPDALLFRTGFGGWEPTLGIDKKGTIFYNARNTNADPGVVRSRDGGKTWKSVPPPAHKVSLDPFLWVDRSTGRVFTSDIDPTITCSPLSYTDDGGESWSTSPACGETDHQNVFTGPPPQGSEAPKGYPNVVYFCAISGGALADSSTATACSKSLDGGKTYVPTGDPAFPPRTAPPGFGYPFCDGGAGHGVTDSRGRVYVPRAWCREPYVAISDDQGKTWRRVKVSDKLLPGSPEESSAGPHEAGVGADRDGNLYYTWVAENHHPYLAISHDGGKSWGDPLDLLPPGVVEVSAFTASVDVGAPGKLALVLMGTRDPKGTPTEKLTWDGYMVTSADALAGDPTFYAASVNDPRTNTLWKGDCGDLRCGNTGDFMDVTIGPDGVARSAFIDGCPNGEKCSEFGVTDPRGEAILGVLAHGPSLTGKTPGCVNFRAGVAGRRLGPARLGRRRSTHRRVFKGARLASRRGIDRFCVAGGGALRIGYPTTRLNRKLARAERRRVRGRALFVGTSSRRYAVRGVRVGVRTRVLRRRLRGERRVRVGRNVWYLARGRRARLAFKTRKGRVLEVGLLDKRLTARRSGARRLLRAWER